MSILTVSNVAKSFGVDLLFQDISFSIAAGQKMGLVGRNGSGKTTLLKILLGQETPDTGRVSLAAGRRLGYLRQEAPVHPEHTIWEEVQTIFAPLRVMEDQLQTIEHAMAEAQTDEALEQAMSDYSELRDKFDAAGGYEYATDLESVLKNLGFHDSDYTKLVGDCSGGEQTRLALAKIVLSKPDLLILDEPTNHLDIDATEWLEGFLKNYEGAVLLVSHDRYFLNAVTDTIGDMENQRLTVYRGNYEHFWQQKQEKIVRQEALFEQQQAEVDRLADIIKKNMGADSIQSRMRHKIQGRIDRMERVERPTSDTGLVKARFDAESAGRIGRNVLQLEEVSKTYGERTLFSDVDVLIERNDRVGLVGPNGAGKTTLVKIILGLEPPTEGVLTMGHNVRLAYFSQHASDSLDPALSVLDTMLETADMTSTEARNYLARFLFTGDDVFKQINMLSGGEKNKLALARMIIQPCNLLILDEPTNHLDIASCEVLTEMLSKYDGTILLISHDRYLLNAITTKTLALIGNGRTKFVEGNYAAWREMERSAKTTGIIPQTRKQPASPKQAEPPVAKAAAPQVTEKPGLNFRELSKARTKARELVVVTETKIAAIEKQIAEVETRLAKPSESVADMVKLAAEHTRLQDDLMAALAAWEKAVADHEALG